MSSTNSSRKESFSARERIWTTAFLVAGLALLSFSLLGPKLTPPPPDPLSEQVQHAGILRVATVNDPLTYLLDRDEPKGFEFDLASRFAESLGLQIRIVQMKQFAELIDAVENGTADMAAASITVTPERAQRVRFGPSYREVTQEVVYRSGSQRPQNAEQLVGMQVAVLAGSSYAETLSELATQVPGLSFKHASSGDIESLFEAVEDGRLDVTVADSNILAIHRRFYPTLTRAFSLTEPQPVAWAFPSDGDASLLNAAETFFSSPETTRLLAQLHDRYFAHVRSYNRIDTHYFLRHIDSRLKDLEGHFKLAAEQTGLDWRLLAAMAYQESHWDSQAVSLTGVRGVMMLTQATARQMGVENRIDPAQSILGGARYLIRVKGKIPERIPEPERTWLGLAAYNVGFGHLEDARIITQRRGGNPDKWSDVASNLPLLSDREWYTSTRYGYARGREPVKYVRNIRSYYDILNWRLARTSPLSGSNALP